MARLPVAYERYVSMPISTLYGKPGTFIGEDQRKDGIVMRRINIRCRFQLPDREFDKNTPMEEIPMLRMLYSYYGGKVVILGGPMHDAFLKYVVQDLTQFQLESVVEAYRRNYNGVNVRQTKVDIFDAIYGRDADCTFLEKMRDVVQMFDPQLPKEQMGPHAEAILDHLFPHAAASVLSRGAQALVGLDALSEPPVPGERAGDAPKPPKPVSTPTIDVPAEKLKRPSEPLVDEPPKSAEPTSLLGDPAPDRELIVHLCDGGFSDEQAYALADMVFRKPVGEWDTEDYQGLPGLTKKNHPRVKRLVNEYFEAQEAQLEAGDDEGGIPLD